jgi:hypothetical protein
MNVYSKREWVISIGGREAVKYQTKESRRYRYTVAAREFTPKRRE